MLTRWRRRTGSLLLGLVLMGGAQVAAAQEAPEPSPALESARAMADRAADAIAAGDYLVAEQLLGRAYAAYPAPTIALLHARALVHLQRLAAAVSVYERATFTRLQPDSPEVFGLAVQEARLELAALRPRVPRLQVVARGGSPFMPIRVTIDGYPLPRDQRGRWLLVDPGRRVVRADLDGARSEQAVDVAEGQSVVVELREPPGSRAAHKAVRFGALGFGAVGLAAGISTGLAAGSAYDRAEQACPSQRCAEGSRGAEELEKFRRYRLLSTVGYLVGGVGLGVASYMFVQSAFEGPVLAIEVDRKSAWLGVGGQL